MKFEMCAGFLAAFQRRRLLNMAVALGEHVSSCRRLLIGRRGRYCDVSRYVSYKIGIRILRENNIGNSSTYKGSLHTLFIICVNTK